MLPFGFSHRRGFAFVEHPLVIIYFRIRWKVQVTQPLRVRGGTNLSEFRLSCPASAQEMRLLDLSSGTRCRFLYRLDLKCGNQLRVVTYVATYLRV